MTPFIRRGRQFGCDERGVTAIEFGILALPFFTIIGATLETAMIFLAGQVLDSAVQDTARLVRTGQAQTAEWDGDDYRAAICDRLYGMFDCTNGPNARMRVNVAVIEDFSEAAIGYPLEIDDDCTAVTCDWTLESDYVPGVGADVVLVRAYYKWPTIINLPGFNFGTLPDGSRLLGSSRVFRNEPFGCSDCT
ncbi:TadE/TadG family type IV pilus assembly protein [Devosia sp. CN2-171]|jgi:Flp pilus assembly protein TadG|uniref:TadE/TadG family type IV pilus assembly protein n=1 Tax=Devosia sp. CN2-171 TaxID=3400909 RepID=UPI003BF86FB6